MAHTTVFDSNGFAIGGRKAERPKGLLSRYFERYTDAMIKAGRARAAREMRNFSDDHLIALGLTAPQVAKFRRTGQIPASVFGDSNS